MNQKLNFFRSRAKFRLFSSNTMSNENTMVEKNQEKNKNNNKEEIKARNLKYYINNKNSLNEKNRQYKNKNKNIIQEKNRNYYLNNKKTMNEKNRIYYINNKDEILKKKKEYNNNDTNKEKRQKYHNKNKDRIMETNRQYYVNNKNIIKEQKKRYNIDNINTIHEKKRENYNNNKVIIKEMRKEYYNNNKDILKEKRKIYYLNNKDIIKEKRRDEYIKEKKKKNEFYLSPPRRKVWNQESMRDYFNSAAPLLHINDYTDWYRVSKNQINKLGGSTISLKFGTLGNALKYAFPEYDWNLSKFSFRGKKSAQRWLYVKLKQLIPNATIIEEFYHPDLAWEKKGDRVQLDIWVAEHNLALEYQGEHHYFDIPGAFGPGTSGEFSSRDSLKKQMCIEKGIFLICIPYWWDGHEDSLSSTLNQTIPHVFPKTASPPIPTYFSR